MKKANKYFALVAFIIILIAALLFMIKKDSQQNTTNPALYSAADRSKGDLLINNHMLKVEIVNTPASIIRGLSGRSEIGSDGMLFVLPERRQGNFWMKDMLFDLDFVWIKNSRVVDLHENIAAPSKIGSGEDINRIKTDQYVDLVLELPVGKIKELQIQIGQSIKILATPKFQPS